MRVACPYTPGGVREEVVRAIYENVKRVTFRDVSGSDFAYWEMICDLWDGTDDLVLIEHDNVITDEVMPAFESCDHDWCSFSYYSFTTKPKPGFGEIEVGLGCTRFSAELQRKFPLDRKRRVLWTEVDREIVSPIAETGLWPEVHGKVKHLHDYTKAHNLFKSFGLMSRERNEG